MSKAIWKKQNVYLGGISTSIWVIGLINRFFEEKKVLSGQISELWNEINKNWKILKNLIPKKNKMMNDVKLMIGNDQVPNKQFVDVLNKALRSRPKVANPVW